VDVASTVRHRPGVPAIEPYSVHAAIVAEREGVPAASAIQRFTRDRYRGRERASSILRARVANHRPALLPRRPGDVDHVARGDEDAGRLLAGCARVAGDVVDPYWR